MRKPIDIDNGNIGRYKARDDNSNSNGVNGGKDWGKVDSVHIDDNANANYDNIIFTMNNTKLYVPVVTLSAKDN